MDTKKVGSFLREIREMKGLSANDVAGKLGCFSMEITYWENGYSLPATNLLLPLSDLYEVSVDEILNAEFKNLASTEQPPNSPCAEQPPNSRGKESEQADTEGETPQIDKILEYLETFQTVATEKKKVPPPAYNYRDQVNKRRAESGIAEVHENLNGFSNFEINLGYVICALFLALLVLITSLKFALKTRNISLDNFEDYLSIRFVPQWSYNNPKPEIRVTAEENIYNLYMEIKLTFSNHALNADREDIVFTVVFSESSALKDEIYTEQTAEVDDYYLLDKMQVIDVKGDLE